MTHELRTPLHAILGFGDLLAISDAVLGGEEAADHLASIISAAENLSDHIDKRSTAAAS